jgi:hypothetical protein
VWESLKRYRVASTTNLEKCVPEKRRISNNHI